MLYLLLIPLFIIVLCYIYDMYGLGFKKTFRQHLNYWAMTSAICMFAAIAIYVYYQPRL